MVEERAQRLTRVADTVLELIEAGADVAVEVVEEFPRGGQRRPRFCQAVEIAGETIAFRSCVGVVQVGGDFRRTEALVVGGQAIADTHNDRLAIAREDHRSWRHGFRLIALESPDRLARVGFIEEPLRVFPCRQFVGRPVGQFGPALMRRSAGLSG
ncbi:hypothetical protein [Pseudomonas sp. BN414]|uniref:hypothetical protein n=1 Tax=Pseudomonas sp. BN414 TaxID=2567888 RepID=UPI00245679F6|nr:hypothetical protein [Pseudomonas sp. BN414]